MAKHAQEAALGFVASLSQHTLVLQSRGCPLRGLPSTPTLEAHRQRFLTNGWEKAHAVDLDTIYKQYIDPQDKRRSCPKCSQDCLSLQHSLPATDSTATVCSMIACGVADID